ncbi:MAG: UDP-N-acetylmuramate dehydrogenase [Bacteroidales bacterium]
MKIVENYSLKSYNTLNFDVKAKYFVELYSKEDLIAFSKMELFSEKRRVVTGLGSNILYLSDFDGVVIHPKLLDIEIVAKSRENIFVKVGAGVEWDSFVEWCVDRGWGGVENLSGIPGCVGASPVQNIGAYGSEVSHTIEEVEYLSFDSGTIESIKGASCSFGYRESIFKRELSGKTVISGVTFKLSINPTLNLEYRDLASLLENIESPTIGDVREAVLQIRSSKLPEPSHIGNAGSFFKNPVISSRVASKLAEEYPQIKLFPLSNGTFKVSAAALIDHCGWKGIREGNVGVHHLQPLVLLAYEGATGEELLRFSKKIAKDIKERFDIEIEPEVNVITSS